MSLVLDASLTLSWYFRDERVPTAQAVLERATDTGAIAPDLWRLEVANALQSALRRSFRSPSTPRPPPMPGPRRCISPTAMAAMLDGDLGRAAAATGIPLLGRNA